MNTLFVDIIEESKTKKEKQNRKIKKEEMVYHASFGTRCKFEFFHFLWEEDSILKSSFQGIYTLKIEQAFLNAIRDEETLSFKHKLMQKILYTKLKNKEHICVIFSDKIEKDIRTKQFLLKSIQVEDTLTITEITACNQMELHDMEYMEMFIKDKKISMNKLKILIAIQDKKDFNQDKLIQYISKYKFVDILRMQGISKADYRYLQDKINAINEEYGTTIEWIQKRNIQPYHIYIINSDILEESFRAHYILRKQSCYLAMKNPDADYLSEACIAYERAKYELETLLNRLGLKKDHFGHNKLGNYLLKNEK